MKKLIFIVLAFWFVTISQAQNFEQLDVFLETLFNNNKIMGSLAISKDGKTVYNSSVGYQFINTKEKKPLTEQSKFRIGSITKTYTAAMIFQLVDEGKIELDDNLSQFFPEIPGAKAITIQQMLNHSSGLFNLAEDADFNEQISNTREQLLAMMNGHELIFEAGEKHEYSNTNYVLLGYILEDLEKDSYSSILNKRIVKPLHLKNTYFGSEIETSNNECLSYYYEDDASLHEAGQAKLTNPGGAGGIVSNPADIIVFLNTLFDGDLMSKASFDIMTTINGEYGSGILSAEKNGMTIFAHNGTIDFFRSMYVYIPEYKTAIVLNTNALDYGMMPILFTAIEALQGEAIKIPSFNTETLTLTETQLNKYVGIYSSDELPFNLVFQTDGKVLKGAPEGSDLKVLKATNKDEFVLEGIGVTLNFDLDNSTLLFKQVGESPKTLTKTN